MVGWHLCRANLPDVVAGSSVEPIGHTASLAEVVQTRRVAWNGRLAPGHRLRPVRSPLYIWTRSGSHPTSLEPMVGWHLYQANVPDVVAGSSVEPIGHIASLAEAVQTRRVAWNGRLAPGHRLRPVRSPLYIWTRSGSHPTSLEPMVGWHLYQANVPDVVAGSSVEPIGHIASLAEAVQTRRVAWNGRLAPGHRLRPVRSLLEIWTRSESHPRRHHLRVIHLVGGNSVAHLHSSVVARGE